MLFDLILSVPLPEEEEIPHLHGDIPERHVIYPNPLPLWPTPWYLMILGYPSWRFRTPAMGWHYLPDCEYDRLFAR